MASTYNPLTIALEIREQLSSEKRKLGFFFGAGVSMAVGIPGIIDLTEKVSSKLEEPFKTQYKQIKDTLPKGANVENILNRIRLISELIGDSKEEEVYGLKGTDCV